MGNFDDREQKDAAVKMVGELDAEIVELKAEVATLRAEKDPPHADAKYWSAWRAAAASEAKLSLEVVALTAQSHRDIATMAHVVVQRDGMAVTVGHVRTAAEAILFPEDAEPGRAAILAALATSPADALAEHDRAVKAEALEEAAIDIVLTPVAEWKRHGNRGIRENAEAAASAWLDARADEYRKAGE